MNEVIKLLVLVSAMLKASHKNIITDIPVPEHWQKSTCYKERSFCNLETCVPCTAQYFPLKLLLNYIITIKKVKLSRYRPGQALGVPRG